MAMRNGTATYVRRAGSLLTIVMILSMTGLSAIGECACLRTAGEARTPSVGASASHAPCCDRCPSDHRCCASNEDPGARNRDAAYAPRPKPDERRPSSMQPGAHEIPRAETGFLPACPSPLSGPLRVPPHIAVTILLI